MVEADRRSEGGDSWYPTKDRDRPNTYVQIVEFPSYEEAMANSNLPGTSTFAAQLASLCDSPPTFRNLDVTHRDEM